MSNSREKILAAVKANQPEEVPLPTVPTFTGDGSLDKFTSIVEAIGGQVIVVRGLSHLDEVVKDLYPTDYRIASELVDANVPVDAHTPIDVLAAVDLAVLRGEMGVAENGAIWLPEATMLNRALPMITQHLVLVLDHTHIVATMHQAYERLGSAIGGYGTFLAGPSKTADIEQSLVIGAHGARSLTVLLY
ncbi:MAG TPA: LUD domain-containing protein [Hymenobacter sp.]|jgi:L-lactate dehydrogenase complex protein LldG